MRTTSVGRVSPFRSPLYAALPCAITVLACSYEPPQLTAPDPDEALFAEEVYPILLRDCAFYACHGNTDRFLRIFGPGRTRLSKDADNYDEPSKEEIRRTFERAKSMLVGVHGIEDSPLLRKPLDAQAGGAGAGHQGADLWGHNVYRSKDDVAYQTLLAWARSSRDAQRDGGARGRDAGSEEDGE